MTTTSYEVTSIKANGPRTLRLTIRSDTLLADLIHRGPSPATETDLIRLTGSAIGQGAFVSLERLPAIPERKCAVPGFGMCDCPPDDGCKLGPPLEGDTQAADESDSYEEIETITLKENGYVIVVGDKSYPLDRPAKVRYDEFLQPAVTVTLAAKRVVVEP